MHPVEICEDKGTQTPTTTNVPAGCGPPRLEMKFVITKQATPLSCMTDAYFGEQRVGERVQPGDHRVI